MTTRMIRTGKVAKLKASIDNGAYGIDAKLSEIMPKIIRAIDALDNGAYYMQELIDGVESNEHDNEVVLAMRNSLNELRGKK